ncbi:hypothetical protein [Thiothrix lacustris]|uniref:hypothetical protein n=1 Tax=Thiothrix lacustris TaxID=525917 RepID=UPI00048D2614|nr:hypothetical protein [Thiothrix lacustris]
MSKVQEQIHTASIEAWALFNLSAIGRKAAFSDDAEVTELAHLFETLEKRLEALHDTLQTLVFSNDIKLATLIENGGAK